MATPLTKRKLLKVFDTARLLAKHCGCDESYVSRWPDDEEIPDAYAYRLLHRIMPEIRRRVYDDGSDAGIDWRAWDRLTANGRKAA